MIVVDSNVLAYLYLPGEHTAAADQLLAGYPEWASPILWRSEFRNILAGYLRKDMMTFDQAIAIQTEAQNLLAGNEYEVDSTGVLQLVRDSNCSAYDCEFVYLAIKLRTTLVTADKKLLQAFPAQVRISLIVTGRFGST